ncbi:MAG TPA: magnesium transporter CorA family protein [Alphaproteobacteria bacterium]|nr:magnesium transporter CorA family protein [Alphaproteobacteria bacterium]
MITVYSHTEGRVTAREIQAGDPLPEDAIWIDLLRPSEEERAALSRAVGVALPTESEMMEIEASSRIYQENGASFLTATVVAKADTTRPEAGPLTFVLTPGLLVTLRFVEPKSIRIFAELVQQQPHLCDNPLETLVVLLETIVDRSADLLEGIGAHLETLSGRAFGVAGDDKPQRRAEGTLKSVLRGLGRTGDLLGKIRLSLAGFERINAYLEGLEGTQHKALKARIKMIQRDLSSLSQHADFQGQRIGFLLDATLGVIGVEQNDIVKSFTVAATVFFPPTLIASIYGMNFDVMPELHWALGYPLALVLMVVSAILPLWYFRRRGWI